MPVEVAQFLCLNDNFGLLARDTESGATASIDAPDGAAIIEEAGRRGWGLTHLFLTHHHADHIQGAQTLRRRYPGLVVVGAAGDAHRLPPLDVAVADGDTVRLGEAEARVIETPGHTLGHIVYYFAADAIAFVGDTLFSLGCGRVFEGTMPMMRRSLEKIARLPGATRIYCGHEYTQSNGRFAATVDPDNPQLKARLHAVDALRVAGRFTLPTTIAEENETNPFLRATDAGIMKAMGLAGADADAVFAEMRMRKNRFAS
jgi:hydroxyacylglutathione hydrolase